MKRHTVTTYQETKLQHIEELKQNAKEAAAILLQEHGPEAVTMRRIADKMGCSTKIIYNLFGSKEGLARQLFVDGCKLLAQSFDSIPEQPDLQQYLMEIGQAYWTFAQVYPSYYKLMYGGAFTEFKPDEESMIGTQTAMQQFMNVIEQAIGNNLIKEKDPMQVIQTIWASLHGVIHLYMGGHLESEASAKSLYDHILSSLVLTLLGNRR